MKRHPILKLPLLCSSLIASLATQAQNTAFTYQGRLNDDSQPATGIYDFAFSLWDAPDAGAQQGIALTNSPTAVSNGVFTVTLDFGNQFPGTGRWLGIAVRTNGADTFSALSPRQPLNPTPYALYAATAAAAQTAASAGSVSASNISGTLTSAQLPPDNLTNFFETVNVGTVGSISDSNTVMAYGSSRTVFNQTYNKFSDTWYAVTPGIFATNQGDAANPFWTLTKTGSGGGGPSIDAFSNSTLAGTWKNFLDPSNTPPTFEFPLKFGATNYTQRLVSSAHTKALFAVTIRDGQLGFPSTGTEESGHFIMSDDDGKTWHGGTGYPSLTGSDGPMRDPAFPLYKLGNLYPLAYTSGSASNHSIFIGLKVSTNLQTYFDVTNITMALPGETLILSNCYHWSPVLTVIGDSKDPAASVWLSVSVSTNNAVNFQQRIRVTSVGQFPYGWSEAFLMNNQTTRTNIIDLTPYWTGTNVVAWYKDDGSINKYVELGKFATTNPASPFNAVLVNDHSNWGGGMEGNWMIPTTNGWFVFATRYFVYPYGGYGDGKTLCRAYSTNITSGWSRMEACITPFLPQSFKPLIATTASEQGYAAAAAHGSAQPRGLNILPDIGVTQSGVTSRGWAFTTPNINTNDFASLSFATHGEAGGIYAKADDSLNLWVATYNFNDSNIVKHTYAKDVIRIVSTNVTINTPVTATAFVTSSDRNAKENIVPVSTQEILTKVAALPISRWNFKQEPGTSHIGPMAQDFYATFGAGTDERHITTVDADGVALAAIQALNEKLEQKDAQIKALQSRLEQLEKMVRQKARSGQ